MLYLPLPLVIVNVKMAQDRIDGHARCRCLMGSVVTGSIAINTFYIVLRGNHPWKFLLSVPFTVPKRYWIFLRVKASFAKVKDTSHESLVHNITR